MMSEGNSAPKQLSNKFNFWDPGKFWNEARIFDGLKNPVKFLLSKARVDYIPRTTYELPLRAGDIIILKADTNLREDFVPALVGEQKGIVNTKCLVVMGHVTAFSYENSDASPSEKKDKHKVSLPGKNTDPGYKAYVTRRQGIYKKKHIPRNEIKKIITSEWRNRSNNEKLSWNTSGSVVNQDDLYDAPKKKTLAASNVTTPEPLPKDHELASLKRSTSGVTTSLAGRAQKSGFNRKRRRMN